MLFRIFKYSIKNSLRNKFLTFSSILVLTLLMLFVNILSMLQNISNTLINSINSKLTISLYIKDEYTETSLEIGDLINEIEKLNKSIQVEYKTKDKILSEIRQREPDLVKIIEKDNPLPDTIVISNIGITDYEKLNDLIIRREYLLANDESQNNYFANYTTQYKKIQDIISILHILQIWLLVIILVFIVSIAVIVYSVIWNFIYYYRDEIYITKLVWGSNMFIYGPFVLQWIIYSFFAFVLSTIIFSLLLENLDVLFENVYTFSTWFSVLFLEMFMFLFIWWISGFLSSKKYLR